MAGHSKWNNIRHKKAKEDSKRSKVWSKCARALMAAARQGGPDPAMNLSLRYAIDEARYANMPRDTIERAIKKGAGELGAANFESVRYEGYGPNGVAVVVDALTDNRSRTAPDVRHLFSKHGGNMGQSGSVAYIFETRGQIVIDSEKTTAEKSWTPQSKPRRRHHRTRISRRPLDHPHRPNRVRQSKRNHRSRRPAHHRGSHHHDPKHDRQHRRPDRRRKTHQTHRRPRRQRGRPEGLRKLRTRRPRRASHRPITTTPTTRGRYARSVTPQQKQTQRPNRGQRSIAASTPAPLRRKPRTSTTTRPLNPTAASAPAYPSTSR